MSSWKHYNTQAASLMWAAVLVEVWTARLRNKIKKKKKPTQSIPSPCSPPFQTNQPNTQQNPTTPTQQIHIFTYSFGPDAAVCFWFPNII